MDCIEKVLVTLLGLFGVPIVIQRPGNRISRAAPSLHPWLQRRCRLISRDAGAAV